MQSNISSKSSTLAGALGICFLSLGCAQVNNPWKDSSLAINDDMCTPSSVAYSQPKAEFAAETRRDWSGTEVEYPNGAVTHWPLWFEDPFEDRGNTDVPMTDPAAQRDLPDNQFTWNWVDYFHMAYGPAREILNAAGWPISAVV